MAIKGRRPTPGPVAAVLGIENNKGELVAQRQQVTGDEHLKEMEDHSTWVGYELRNTPSFSLQAACMEYFQLYVGAQPKGYFSNADVPTLEKLCVINVLYDRAMNEYMERSLMQNDDILGERVDPHLAVMVKLADQAARFVKLLGIGPLDRGRPVIDIFGKPLVYGKATVSAEQENAARIQDKYWGKRADQKRGLN